MPKDYTPAGHLQCTVFREGTPMPAATAVMIRPMTIEDYDEVFALWLRTAKQGPGLCVRDADSRPNIQRYLDRNPGMSFIAESHERIIGAVLSGHDGRRGFIHHLAVEPNFRRRGTGRQLIGACEQALLDAGIGKAHLLVHMDNHEAGVFWAQTGWSERDDVRLMSKALTGNPDE